MHKSQDTMFFIFPVKKKKQGSNRKKPFNQPQGAFWSWYGLVSHYRGAPRSRRVWTSEETRWYPLVICYIAIEAMAQSK